jgi:peptide/nickel transport system substrate-binding protein
VDKGINDGRAEGDPAKRAQIYEGVAAQVLKDRPIVYLYHRHWLWAHSSKLSGFRTVPDGMVRVQGLKLN